MKSGIVLRKQQLQAGKHAWHAGRSIRKAAACLVRLLHAMKALLSFPLWSLVRVKC